MDSVVVPSQRDDLSDTIGSNTRLRWIIENGRKLLIVFFGADRTADDMLSIRRDCAARKRGHSSPRMAEAQSNQTRA